MPMILRNTDILFNSNAVLASPPGTAPMFASRAWVNFNGTGTVAIRASGNVSSITDNGVGNYTVNFTTAMPDANYAVNSTCSSNVIDTIDASIVSLRSGNSTTACNLNTGDANTQVFQDSPIVSIAIFR